MFVSQDKENASSLLLPGLLVDIVPDPGQEIVIDNPQQESSAELLGVSGHDGVPTKKGLSETTSVEMPRKAHDWESLIPERVSEVYMADSPGLLNDLGDDVAMEGFLHSPEEEPRGGVFMNDKWLQHFEPSNSEVHVDALTSPLPEKLPEMPREKDDEILALKRTEKVLKKVKDEFGNPGYVKSYAVHAGFGEVRITF